MELNPQNLAKALEKADIVVAGGWGIGSKIDWQLLEQSTSSCGL
jgi:electron transfer flavoprotein alpha subunit